MNDLVSFYGDVQMGWLILAEFVCLGLLLVLFSSSPSSSSSSSSSSASS